MPWRRLDGWLRPWQSGEPTTLFIRSPSSSSSSPSHLMPRAQQRRGKRKKTTLTRVQPVKGPFKVYQTVPSPSSGGRVGCWVGSFGRYAPPSGRRMETGRTEPFPFPMQTPFYFANWNNDRCVSFLPSIRWKPELIIGTFRKSISASFCLRFVPPTDP